MYLGKEAMSIQEDNKDHRAKSNELDAKYGGNFLYENVARPIVHGAYHGARYLGYEAQKAFDPEELARAKDQFSAIGKGQPRTEYLKEHREQQEQQKQRDQQEQQDQ